MGGGGGTSFFREGPPPPTKVVKLVTYTIHTWFAGKLRLHNMERNMSGIRSKNPPHSVFLTHVLFTT